MAAPFFFHWYVSVPVPVAATEKLATCPAVTLWLAGCVVMARAVIPFPLREMAMEELVASLDTATLPLALPTACGANWS